MLKNWFQKNKTWLIKFKQSMFSYFALGVTIIILSMITKLKMFPGYQAFLLLGIMLFGIPAFVLQVCIEKLWSQFCNGLNDIKETIKRGAKKK